MQYFSYFFGNIDWCVILHFISMKYFISFMSYVSYNFCCCNIADNFSPIFECDILDVSLWSLFPKSNCQLTQKDKQKRSLSYLKQKSKYAIPTKAPKTKSTQTMTQASIAVRPSAFGMLVVMVLKILTRTRKTVMRRVILKTKYLWERKMSRECFPHTNSDISNRTQVIQILTKC